MTAGTPTPVSPDWRPASDALDAVTVAHIDAAAARIEGVVRRTPVLTSSDLDRQAGASVYLKCEPMQRTGSFKFRGAYHALSRLTDDERARGVLTFSSGNHAQAIARAGRELGIATTIIMPSDAPPLKRAATVGYGAEVIDYHRDETTREELAGRLAEERGLVIVPPYDHPDVIAGQGTVARELLAATADGGPLDLVVVCLGGGGLLSGCATYIAAQAPDCLVIGVEPEAGNDGQFSHRTGTLHTVRDPVTIADGARTPSLGRYTFPLIRRYVHDIWTVPDDSLCAAVQWVRERRKLVVEPTGVLALAAILDGLHKPLQPRLPAHPRIGVVLTGGNVTPSGSAPAA